MNFYKVIEEEYDGSLLLRKRTLYYNLDIVQCFVIDDNKRVVYFYYSSDDYILTPLTDELIKKLKEMGVLK
jgi:hypothetical protein